MRNNAQHRLAMVLKSLGDNAEDVASLLQYGGWRGQLRDANSCPVALYLRTVMAEVTEASVGSQKGPRGGGGRGVGPPELCRVFAVTSEL